MTIYDDYCSVAVHNSILPNYPFSSKKHTQNKTMSWAIEVGMSQAWPIEVIFWLQQLVKGPVPCVIK